MVRGLLPASGHTSRQRARSRRRDLTLTTALPYIHAVRTVAETSIFGRYAAEIWNEQERDAFIAFIAASQEAGNVIPGSGGCRKVRWSVSGSGKRGGVRVIYFLQSEEVVWLLIAYKKSKFDRLSSSFLAELRRQVEDAV